MAAGPDIRGVVLISVLAVAAVLGAIPVAAQPVPVAELSVPEVGFQSINITFETSPSPNVQHYVIFVSGANASTVDKLEPTLAANGTFRRNTTYDMLYVAPPENVSALPAWTFETGRFFYENDTSGGWASGRRLGILKYIPSDATRVRYSISGILAGFRHYVAVAPVDAQGVMNENITTVSAVPLGPPVEHLPGNESVLLSLGGIMLALGAAFAMLWRRSGPASRPAYAYVGPAVAALAVLTFYPTAVGFFLSFTDRTLTAGRGGFDYNILGLENYFRVFERPEFGLVASTTIVWTVVNVFFHVAVGLVLAVLLNRKIVARPIYRTLFLLPWAIPSYISVLAWRGMFDRGGVIDFMFAGSIDWLGSMPAALVAVISANVWLGIPFMMMVFSGALQSIPVELYEAADVDGLSRWQKFRRITLPLLKPTIVPASLLGFIWTFNMFNVIYLMTQGRPTVAEIVGSETHILDAGATDILITYVYREGFQPFWRQGFAAAYSVVIFFMLLTFSLSYTRYTRAIESFAGERVPLEPSRLRRALAKLGSPLQRVVAPVKRASSREQPETIDIPLSLSVLFLALGVVEVAYGAQVLADMDRWSTLAATHGSGFVFLGLLRFLSGGLLAGGRTSGRLLGMWVALFEIGAGLLAPGWLGVPVLLPLGALAILSLLAHPWPQPSHRPATFGAMFDRIGGAWYAFLAALPRGRGMALLERGLLHGFLILFAIFSVFPLLMVIGTAFSTNINSLSTINIPLLGPWLAGGTTTPRWGWDAFDRILSRSCGAEACFMVWLRNSIVVSAGTTVWGLFVALRAGYGFSRFSFSGKNTMMLSFLVVQMFPGAIILIPYYLLMQQLGLLNNPVGLILAYSVTALPFMVWMLKGFFDTIPRDLEEAAMVDGCSRSAAFRRVILPLALPALAVTALFSFLSAWSEWLLAFTFMSQERNFTLPVGISSLVQPPNIFWNQYAALSLIVSIPVIILFIVFQRYLISGLTRGAVKG